MEALLNHGEGLLVPERMIIAPSVGQAILLVAPWEGIFGVLAFAGIGDPEKFFATLAEAGVSLAATQSFPDHHRYRERDLRDGRLRPQDRWHAQGAGGRRRTKARKYGSSLHDVPPL